MKNDANYLNRNLAILFLSLFTMGFSYAQMEETDSQENSVLKSFKDTSLEWGDCPPFVPEGCHIAVLHGDAGKANADVLINLMGIQVSQIIGIIRMKGWFYYQVIWINL